jgi:hypothetical protein
MRSVRVLINISQIEHDALSCPHFRSVSAFTAIPPDFTNFKFSFSRDSRPREEVVLCLRLYLANMK